MTDPQEPLVGQRVALARAGRNPTVVAQMPSGWLVMADKQVLPGQLILMADPPASSLNGLTAEARAHDPGRFGRDAAVRCLWHQHPPSGTRRSVV